MTCNYCNIPAQETIEKLNLMMKVIGLYFVWIVYGIHEAISMSGCNISVTTTFDDYFWWAVSNSVDKKLESGMKWNIQVLN
jgi:hypothetical protein